MKILIDNSGLHSSVRPLFSKPNGEVDIRGLFQLSTLLIFCEEINLAGLEESAVANRTFEIIDNLKSIGIKEDIINVQVNDLNLLKKVCKITAEECAEDLKFFTIQKKVEIDGLRPEALPDDSYDLEVYFLDIINEKTTNDELKEMQEKFAKRKMDGAIHYMFSISEKLRNALKEIVKKNPKISQNQLYQINSYLRFRLNENFGKIKKIKYTPSIGRASILRNGNNFILSELSKSIDNSVEVYTGEKIITPSLIKYLFHKSKGNPLRMIEESLKAREKSKELRQWLLKITNEINQDSGEEKFKVKEQIKELSMGLLWDLNINTPKLTDVFEVSLAYGFIPNIKIKGMELSNYLKYSKQKNKLSILTEISKELIFIESEIDLKEIMKRF